MERSDSLRVFTNDNGYVFQNGKLQQVKWLRTDFKYDHREGEYMFYHATTTYQLPDGSLDKLQEVYGGYDNAYDTIEGYEKGESAETTYMTCCHPSERHYRTSDDVIHDIINDRGLLNNTVVFWEWDEDCHCPRSQKLELDKFCYDYTKRRFCSDELSSGKLYNTEEEALSFNSYVIVDENGNKTTRDGINKLLMLDDDQKELIKQFCDIVKKIDASGIELIGDYDSLQAFNVRKIKDFAIDCEEQDDEEWQKAKRYDKAFELPVQIGIWGEDNDFYVKRKEE